MATNFLQQLGFDDEGNILWDATGDRPLLISATSAERFGVDYNNSPSRNVRAFNAALQRRNFVTLTRPGQYLIGGPGEGGLIIPSNTTLVLADGVELIVADQTFQPLIRNENAFHPGTTLTGAAVQWVGPGLRAIIDFPNIGLLHPVGTWIALLNLPNTNSNNRNYQGVYYVREATQNQIAFLLCGAPPSGGNSATGGIIYPADNNLRIIGGVWDGNETGQSGSGYQDGDPRQHIHSLRNVQNLIVRGPTYRKGEAWCFGSNNLRDFTVEDIQADTWSGNGAVLAHDIVHLAGGHRNGLIQRINADCDDNTIGMTLDDVVNNVGVPVSYVTAGLYFPGDTYDITIRDIQGRTSEASIIALWGNTNYHHFSTTIERITAGRCNGSAVQLSAPYNPTNMLNCNGGMLTLRDVSGTFNTAPVRIVSDGVWDHVVLDNIRNSNIGTLPLVQVVRATTTQTISRLEINNVAQYVPGTGLNRSQPVVEIRDSNINDLEINGVPTQRFNANVSAVQFVGSAGSVLRATVAGVAGVANQAGDSFIVSCENTNATALNRLVVRDSTMVGNTATGGVVRQATTGRVTTVLVDNCAQTGGEGIYISDNGVNPAAATVRTP